jgi:N-dimethylarginine dimethylaminohydrolase
MKETPSNLPIQSYLLNFPFTLSTENHNNIWMQEMSPSELQINRPRAYRQFIDLYNFLAGNSLVYLLPSEGNFQDQTYVANLGIHLSHLDKTNTVILSNFSSEPRVGEEKVGETFFKQMGYETIKSPYKFEGEADLKHLYDKYYVGGYGIRSNIRAYDWMEENFDMEILKLAMKDEYLYHLDCSVFPINTNKTLVCTELYSPIELKQLENLTDIIDISLDDALGGITNSVRISNMVLCASNISELSKDDEYYMLEKNKIKTLENICSNEGMEPVIFNISEFMKSGAMLSCMVFHLNRIDYNKILI